MKHFLFILVLFLVSCGQQQQSENDSEENLNEESELDQDVVDESELTEDISEREQSKISDVVAPLVGSWFTAVKVKGDWYEVGGENNQLHILQNSEEDYSIRKKDRCGNAIQLEHEVVFAEIADNGDFILECKHADSEKKIKMIGSYQRSDENWPARIFSLKYNEFAEIITEGVMGDYEIESVKLYKGAEQGKEPVFYDNYDCETGEDPDEVENK